MNKPDIYVGAILRSNNGCGPLHARVMAIHSDGSVLLQRWNSKTAHSRRHVTPFSLPMSYFSRPTCGWRS